MATLTITTKVQTKKSKSKDKFKVSLKDVKSVNPYGALDGKDGNPQTPAEFDESPHDAGELFFQADEDADEVTKNRILILNYIHSKLHAGIARVIPSDMNHDKNVELFHREEFAGVSLDVCVYFSGDKSCFAAVKLTSTTLDDESHCNGAVFTPPADWNVDAKGDGFAKAAELKYWIPRWKYVVKYLRDSMYKDFEKDGTVIDHPEPEPEVVIAQDNFADTGETLEETFEVFAGSTGKIIGPKGAKINEIRAATKIENIEMPKKVEGERPRARDKVSIILKGTKGQIEKAKNLLQDVVDEWVNAPRPPRNTDYSGGSGGYGGTDGAADTGSFQQADTQPVVAEGNWDVGGSGAVTASNGGSGDWADDVPASNTNSGW